ncbi:hypothetical protein N1851_020176 [Merluccius polli]|uniref:Uncharacterized protein n=1 Tax=Merluccius polli TaxID=89951 RepID=A0AA47MKP7_MERPO|nr:hypothetical protein N1851_020176 [Merluccius polli]
MTSPARPAVRAVSPSLRDQRPSVPPPLPEVTDEELVRMLMLEGQSSRTHPSHSPAPAGGDASISTSSCTVLHPSPTPPTATTTTTTWSCGCSTDPRCSGSGSGVDQEAIWGDHPGTSACEEDEEEEGEQFGADRNAHSCFG